MAKAVKHNGVKSIKSFILKILKVTSLYVTIKPYVCFCFICADRETIKVLKLKIQTFAHLEKRSVFLLMQWDCIQYGCHAP